LQLKRSCEVSTLVKRRNRNEYTFRHQSNEKPSITVFSEYHYNVNGLPRDVYTGAAGAFHGADTGGAHTIAIEHAINMLLARVAFDLMRSPKFKLQIIAHIQKKLDELKVPDYINALQVSHGHLACHHAS